MDVIADELRKNNVNVDVETLTEHIQYMLDNFNDTYTYVANRFNSDQLVYAFHEICINTVGRAMAYLALVYRMNYYDLFIPEEEPVREAVRLVVPILRNAGRVEGSFTH